MVTVAVAPLGMLPKSHEMGAAEVQEPWLAVTLLRISEGSMVAKSVAPTAAFGPALVNFAE